jgi:hypothetical protein
MRSAQTQRKGAMTSSALAIPGGRASRDGDGVIRLDEAHRKVPGADTDITPNECN